MKKYAILGATGKTGGQLLQQAVEQGHQVVALCRNPAKLTIKHENVQAVEADVLSAESMKPHFIGCDAVFSCLGIDSGIVRSTTFYSDSMKAIAEAMRATGVERLIAMTSWYTNYRQNDGGPFFHEWIMKPIAGLIIGRHLSNMAMMERFLIDECQDINFTIVKPPGLNDQPISGKEIVTEECQYIRASSYYMPRADVAKFMLAALDTSKFNKMLIAIAS